MAFAQLSKVRLEYFPHGEGPERVVLIHGFQASARIWRLTQEALPADRYTSIAINNRGAGGGPHLATKPVEAGVGPGAARHRDAPASRPLRRVKHLQSQPLGLALRQPARTGGDRI